MRSVFVKILYVVIICLTIIGCHGHGSVNRDIVESLHLGDTNEKVDTEISVYLPPGYRKLGKGYPVLYLINGGAGGDNNEFFENGRLATYSDVDITAIADELISSGDIEPIVIVGTGLTGLAAETRDLPRRPLVEYFLGEIVPHVESTYNIRKGREAKGIGGWSDGGGNAVEIGFLAHSEFSCLLLFSPFFGDDAGNISNLETYLSQGLVLDGNLDFDTWLKGFNPDETPMNIWTRFGESDEWGIYEIGLRFSDGLGERGVENCFISDSGGHWPSSEDIEKGLKFFSMNLRK